MKRILSLILAGVLSISLLASCSSTPTESTDGAEQPAAETQGDDAPSGDTVNLDLWHYWNDAGQQQVLADLSSSFTAQNPNITVGLTNIPYGEYTQKILTAAVSGDAPDLLMYGNNETSVLAEAGVLSVMSEIVLEGGYEDRLLPEILNTHYYNGEYYGMPIYGNCLALFYNKEYVPEPPTTWDELMTMAAEITTPDMHAIAVSAIENEEGTFQFLPFLWSAGADLDTLDSENGIAALNLYKELVDNGYMSQEVVNWEQQDVMLQFANGSAAMMVNGPWNVPNVESNAPDMDWGITVLPALEEGGSASILGGESFGISTNADVENAQIFFDFVYAPENYLQLVKDLGQLPPELSLLEDEYYANDPIYGPFSQNLIVAKARAYGPDYNEMSKAIQVAITSTLTGLQTPEEAMTEAASVVNGLLPQE